MFGVLVVIFEVRSVPLSVKLRTGDVVEMNGTSRMIPRSKTHFSLECSLNNFASVTQKMCKKNELAKC